MCNPINIPWEGRGSAVGGKKKGTRAGIPDLAGGNRKDPQEPAREDLRVVGAGESLKSLCMFLF